jgi:hypothetical protein
MRSVGRPPLKHCPVCGVAMIASKSHPAAALHDTFTCLSCDTILTTLVPGRTHMEEEGK